jgi:hypothetical protein
VARDARVAERKATKAATEVKEAAERAAEAFALGAALKAEHEAREAEYTERIEKQAALEAEQQAARDATQPGRLKSGKADRGRRTPSFRSGRSRFVRTPPRPATALATGSSGGVRSGMWIRLSPATSALRRGILSGSIRRLRPCGPAIVVEHREQRKQ